jgi:hypothetical protein
MEQTKQAAFEKELIKLQLIAGLRHAIDACYRRFTEGARADWERLFGCKDAADACVTVRTSAEQLATQSRAVRGSGFLKSRRPRENNPRAKHGSPRFAH